MKNLMIKGPVKKQTGPGFPICSTFHRILQNPQGSGRSSDLLRLFSTPSRPFWDGQWQLVEPFKELTAAGTVAGLHGIPYYPFPEPMPCKSRKINWRKARIFSEVFNNMRKWFNNSSVNSFLSQSRSNNTRSGRKAMH